MAEMETEETEMKTTTAFAGFAVGYPIAHYFSEPVFKKLLSETRSKNPLLEFESQQN